MRALAQNAFLIGSLVILFFMVTSFSSEFIRARKINEEIMTLQNEITVLQQKNTELGDLIKYFDSESYAERKARTELGMRKPDENVLIIPETSVLRDASQPGSASQFSDLDNPHRWWEYFLRPSGR